MKIIDLVAGRVVSSVVLDQTFYGLCWDPPGERLFVSGAEYEVIHEFAFDGGYICRIIVELHVGQTADRCPFGRKCSADGQTLYVANPWGDTVALIPLSGENEGQAKHIRAHPRTAIPTTPFPAGRQAALCQPVGARRRRGGESGDGASRRDLDDRCASDRDALRRRRGSAVSSPAPTATPSAVIDTDDGKAAGDDRQRVYPHAPIGSTPNSLALSPDEQGAARRQRQHQQRRRSSTSPTAATARRWASFPPAGIRPRCGSTRDGKRHSTWPTARG